MGDAGIQTDWSLMTAGEWAKFQENPLLAENQVAVLRRVVTACPWGDPAEESTWINDELTTPEFEAAANEAVAQKPEPEDLSVEIEGGNILFDWNLLTTKALVEFQKQSGRVRGQIAVLQKVVVMLPSKWGNPADEETYLKLPLPRYEGLWRAAQEAKSADKFR